MKCPFTHADCIERECPGWAIGRCFVELFLQRLDTISLKLDTLCNLTSMIGAKVPGRQKGTTPKSGTGSPEKDVTERIVVTTVPEEKEATPWHPTGLEEVKLEEPTSAAPAAKPVVGGRDEPVARKHNHFPGLPTKVSDIVFIEDVEEQTQQPIEREPMATKPAPVSEVSTGPREAMTGEAETAGPTVTPGQVEKAGAPSVDVSAPATSHTPVETGLSPEPAVDAKTFATKIRGVETHENGGFKSATDALVEDLTDTGTKEVLLDDGALPFELAGETAAVMEPPPGRFEVGAYEERSLDEKAILELEKEEKPVSKPSPEEVRAHDIAEPVAAQEPVAPKAELKEKTPEIVAEPLPAPAKSLLELEKERKPAAKPSPEEVRAHDIAEPVAAQEPVAPKAELKEKAPEIVAEPLPAPAKSLLELEKERKPAAKPSPEEVRAHDIAEPVAAQEPVAQMGAQPESDEALRSSFDQWLALTSDVPETKKRPSVESVDQRPTVLQKPFPERVEAMPEVVARPEVAARQGPPRGLDEGSIEPGPEPAGKVAEAAVEIPSETPVGRTAAVLPGDEIPPVGPFADTSGIEVSVEEITPDSAETPFRPGDPAHWATIEVKQPSAEAILGIDFGTTFSKVALRLDDATAPVPIPLALTARNILKKAHLTSVYESENDFVEDSLIYFDQNDHAFCGTMARKFCLDTSESGVSRPAIQNLKTFFIRGGANMRIHDDFFPASESMESQDVLALYFAYLLRLTRTYLNEHSSELPVDLDSAVRYFSIPAWIEDQYREAVKFVMKAAIAKAYCLEKWLKDDLVKGVHLVLLREALKESTKYQTQIHNTLVGSARTEAAAAGHTRVLTLASEPNHPLNILVINVGAGFTDFALFSATYPDEQASGPMLQSGPILQVEQQGGVGTGVGVWDNALRAFIYSRIRDVAGAKVKHDDLRIFKAKLEMKLQGFKEHVLASPDGFQIDCTPVLSEPVKISREELEKSLPVKAALFTLRDSLRNYIKQAVKTMGMHRFDPAFTEILVTGGGSFIPSIVECIRESVTALGPTYASKVKAGYISPLYTSIPGIAKIYPMIAVALGTAEKDYPAEKVTAEQPPPEPKLAPRANNHGAYHARGMSRQAMRLKLA